MTPGPRFRIRLAKEDFKFSAAHFTVFADGSAELLHGHNYQLEVEIGGTALDEHGLLLDLDATKGVVRRLCSRLDGRTLLPERSPLVTWRRREGEVEVSFGSRRYCLPEEDVAFLPLVNSSIELLARLLWQRLSEALDDPRVDWLSVSVAETSGQACLYEAPLDSSRGEARRPAAP